MNTSVCSIIVAFASAAWILPALAQQATPAVPPTAIGEAIQVTGSNEPLTMIKPPRPRYPRDARGISGWVRVECVVSPKGRVQSVRIVGSEPARIFDQAAIDAMEHARFNRSKSTQPRPMVQRLNFKAD